MVRPPMSHDYQGVAILRSDLSLKFARQFMFKDKTRGISSRGN